MAATTSLIWVDKLNTGNNDGSIGNPFHTIAAAVASAKSLSLASPVLRIAPGDYSAEPVAVLDQARVWLLEGVVSGMTHLPAITVSVTGTPAPWPTSGLVLRNCSVGALIIADGSPPAGDGVVVAENVLFTAGITQSGTSPLSVLLSGISSANGRVEGTIVSSLVTGPISLPHANLALSNTQVQSTCTCNKLTADGCQFDGAIFIGDISAQFSTCVFATGALTFTGSPGTVVMDSCAARPSVQNGAYITVW